MSRLIGQITRSYGRRFIVESAGHEYDSTTRGKRVDFACGDYVNISVQNQEQAVIEELLPRQSLLYRQDCYKTKLIAANVTRVLFVLAAEPSPNEELLNRCLLAAEAAHIEPIIVVNKSDLPGTGSLKTLLEPYKNLGYQVVTLSARVSGAAPLLLYLTGHTSILLGQSGMGKSTLINALLPHAQARTAEISSALDSGRHTTTHAALFHLNATSNIIDSPGLQEFGLNHLAKTELAGLFPEMRRYLGQCRFHNCTHTEEPGCAIKSAAEHKSIYPNRLALLQKLTRAKR